MTCHHQFRLLSPTSLSSVFLLLLSACFASPCHADLVVNGDFSSGAISDFENQMVFNEHDLGWGTKNALWSINASGEAERALSGAGAGAGLAQVNTIMMETGNEYELCLDWTADAGATITDDLDLSVYVVAWKAGTSPTGSGDTGQRFFTGLNFESRQSRVIGTGGSWTDLNDGSVQTGNGNADAFTINGSAGTTVSSTFTLNFGADSIEDFDFFGIKIQSVFGTDGGGGGTIDNIVVKDVSVVPEPSSLLVVAGMVMVGMCGRRKKLLA